MQAAIRPTLDQISGVLTLAAIVLALLAANSSLSELYNAIHHAPIRIGIPPYQLDEPLITWINQGLMTLFFLLVSLEIKQELVKGRLSTLRAAALPAFAALGGMVMPAAIYVAFTAGGGDVLRGWAIPMATDIALALATLSLLGNRVPAGIKVFLMALAIFDDLGAVAVIVFFYGEDVHLVPLIFAAATFAGLVALSRLGLTHPLGLAVLGSVLWLALFRSGVEPAIAGVFVGSVIPMDSADSRGLSPLRRAEHVLRPLAGLLIVPLFGFFNAGVTIEAGTLQNVTGPVSLGVFFGLVLGKQFGVFGATWFSVRMGIGKLPPGIRFRDVYGAALLSGVGFTMALFVTTLAFASPTMAASARLAILAGSSLSAVAGIGVLWFVRRDGRG